jgi:nucleoside-diphosphate-sugar epimerase
VQAHAGCRYVFLSSGAVYAGDFEEAADVHTPVPESGGGAYIAAKREAEARHRQLSGLPITDIRLFNYVSRRQNLEARFLVADMFRALRDGTELVVSDDNVMRDYLHPRDWRQLMLLVLQAAPENRVLDAYSMAPVEKFQLLEVCASRFGLRWRVEEDAAVQATGVKPEYYSLRREAESLGYQPRQAALDGVIAETGAVVAQFTLKN